MRPRYLSARLLLAVALLPAEAGWTDVLHDRVNGPLTGIFGIPDSTEGGRLLPLSASAWSLSYGIASHSIEQSAGDESLSLDGETSRLEFRYRYGLGDRLELGLEVPFVQHEGGNLDSLIDSWHQFFNLPEGQRPGREQNVLDFDYVDSTGNPVNMTESARGIGDVRVFAGWKLSDSDGHDMALRFSAKFPTGNAEEFLGSGGTDISVGLAGDVDALFGVERLNAFYRASATYLGEPEFLADRYREWAGRASLGAGFWLARRVELRAQAAIRSALYDSEIRYLGNRSTTLTFGGNILLSDRYRLSIAVSEDVDVSSAPDVSFLVALRYHGE